MSPAAMTRVVVVKVALEATATGRTAALVTATRNIFTVFLIEVRGLGGAIGRNGLCFVVVVEDGSGWTDDDGARTRRVL